jgi:hypothetical protein
MAPRWIESKERFGTLQSSHLAALDRNGRGCRTSTHLALVGRRRRTGRVILDGNQLLSGTKPKWCVAQRTSALAEERTRFARSTPVCF